jgi:ferritin-like metal-binding protein YciE
MKNLKDLFEHQLKDLYSAENQIITARKPQSLPISKPNL